MNAPSELKLSISIVCYHTALDHLQSLLNSLSQNLQDLQRRYSIHTTVTLIDNSEDHSLNVADLDSQQESLSQQGAQLLIKQGHGNIGYGAGHNLAVTEADSDYHLLLNPDVILGEHSLTEGIAYLEQHADALVVSPHASFPDGSKQYLCKRYPSFFIFLLRGFVPETLRRFWRSKLDHFEMRDLPEDQPSANVPIVSGCCMLCRTSALQAVDGFDPRYFLYFEDFDLSLRLGGNGQLAYVPAMKIVHSGGNSSRKGLRHIRLFARSGWCFFSTHGWRIF